MHDWSSECCDFNGWSGTFSARLVSVVCICEYAATVVGICGRLLEFWALVLKVGSLASPRSVVRASSDVAGLTAVTTSKLLRGCCMYRAIRCRHSQPESHPHHMDALCTGSFAVVTLSLSHIHITWMLYVQGHSLSSLSARVTSTLHGCCMYRVIRCRHSQPESHPHHTDAVCTGPFAVITLSQSHIHITRMLYVQGHSLSSLSVRVTSTSHGCCMYRAIHCRHSQPESHPHHTDAVCTGPFAVVTLSQSHIHITRMLYVQGHSLSSLSVRVTSTSHGLDLNKFP